MPKKRSARTNPFIESLMKKHGVKYIKDILKFYPDMSYRQLQHYADITEGHRTLEAVVRDAKIFGLTTDEFIKQLLGSAAVIGLLLLPAPALAARCVGANPCHACHTCEYCKHCAVRGGHCGVCKSGASSKKPEIHK